jgi:hypothetical protein
MIAPIKITVFPRLDCCVPDYTGKNRLLGEVLAEVKQNLGDQVHIEVISTATRAERLKYYERMLEALLAAGQPLPFPVGYEQLALYREAIRQLRIGRAPSPSTLAGLRQFSAYFFHITPIIAFEGKAVFVTAVPTAAEMSDAIKATVTERSER